MRSSASFLGASLLTAALTASAPVNLSPPSSPVAADLVERGGTAPSICANLMVIFARGTTELGPLGEVVGPPLKEKIASMLGNAATFSMQGVPAPVYPADIPGFLAGGSASGSKAMAKMATKAVESCPQSKIVLSGYSQGGQVVHNACKQLPPAITSKVSAVIFGDPDKGDPVLGVNPGNVKVFCHPDDNICQHGDTILASHLTYGAIDTPAAASFIVAGTPAGAVVPVVATRRENTAAIINSRSQDTASSDDDEDLYNASQDVVIPASSPDANAPQRVPTQNGPPPNAAAFSPPGGVLPAAPTERNFDEDHRAGPQDVPIILNLSNLPAAFKLSPVKRKLGKGKGSGPQDVPSIFNKPNLPAALSPVKE